MAQGVALMFISIGQILSSVLIGAIAIGAGYASAFLVTGIISMILIVLAAMLKNQSAEIATREAVLQPSMD
jgi:sugar phosphate permease